MVGDEAWGRQSIDSCSVKRSAVAEPVLRSIHGGGSEMKVNGGSCDEKVGSGGGGVDGEKRPRRRVGRRWQSINRGAKC
ncbi:hypothetical protein TorRG33x02_123220 [Trema orientale]|uniref:Uncharacterized protein n=1 Tax=Trema orientale TaxID=63057 RepID=A0A2P5F2H5_TREOI|nr:hypothetical protein TorRG33x02_123220 [Trema orientale]